VGNLTITGWQSCWLGVFPDTITRNVEFNENVNADPDADEIANNSIGHNLNCAGNSPNPQIGDSEHGLRPGERSVQQPYALLQSASSSLRGTLFFF